LRFTDNVLQGALFPHVELPYQVFQAMEQDQNLQNRFYQVLQTSPLYRYFLGRNADFICENREALPSLKDLIRGLDPQKIEKMSLGEGILWYQAFLNNPEEWKGGNANLRPLFMKHFILGLKFLTHLTHAQWKISVFF